jgi:hypothetical protein
METILNLIWLAVTLAGVCVWRFRWFPSRRNQRERIFPETVATLCLIALLFPVISLTDDLHPEIMIAECVSAKRNLCQFVARGPGTSGPTAASQVHSSWALMMRPPAQPDLIALDTVLSFRIPQTASSSSTHVGRSPPAFS